MGTFSSVRLLFFELVIGTQGEGEAFADNNRRYP